MESVCDANECVNTTHLVTNQPENVIMVVVITGLENFAKVRLSLIPKIPYIEYFKAILIEF